jgi:hypothetical protein
LGNTEEYDDFVAERHNFVPCKLTWLKNHLFILWVLLAHWLLTVDLVPLNALNSKPVLYGRLRYSQVLRCIGQSLESMDLKAIEVKTHGEDFVVQIWNKGTSASMDAEKHYTPAEINELELQARTDRDSSAGPPNLLSLSQILRLAGNYVDRMRGRLTRVSWQDQSEKIQSITIQYEPLSKDRDEQSESQIATIEELCVHVYKQRKKIAVGSDKHSHRPFVSVGNIN